MTTRTDDERVMLGRPVMVEQGRTPGAVARLREELRSAASNLPEVASRIRACEQSLQNALAEQTIWRESCDELIDAIHALGGS